MSFHWQLNKLIHPYLLPTNEKQTTDAYNIDDSQILNAKWTEPE